MELKYKEIVIRNATTADAEQLCAWWNDGAVMAHAGFPKGLGTTPETVACQIMEDDSRHIILYDGTPIGEMNYRDIGNGACEIGIKICNADMQNKGLGKVILSLFIGALFDELKYNKIVLDTNLNNTRAQHVYEQLGFQKVRVNVDSWKNQLGELQSSVDYELVRGEFVSFL